MNTNTNTMKESKLLDAILKEAEKSDDITERGEIIRQYRELITASERRHNAEERLRYSSTETESK